jgi:hypothetical protein
MRNIVEQKVLVVDSIQQIKGKKIMYGKNGVN